MTAHERNIMLKATKKVLEVRRRELFRAIGHQERGLNDLIDTYNCYVAVLKDLDVSRSYETAEEERPEYEH